MSFDELFNHFLFSMTLLMGLIDDFPVLNRVLYFDIMIA